MTKTKKDEGVLYIRGLPEELRRRFKVSCIQQGISMGKRIEQLIREALKSKEKQA